MCNNVRDLYKLRDFWTLNSPDINTVDYKIWDNESTRQYVTDIRQRLTDVWFAVEQSVIDDGINSGTDVFMPAFKPQKDILNIHCDMN